MLVLSRGRNDQIVFPTLGMSVEVLRITGNKVRLGIDAPRNIPVVRHEVAERGEYNVADAGPGQDGVQLTHAMRNRVHTAVLGLHVLHKQFESGETDDAEATIFKIFNELKAIEDELNPPTGTTRPAVANKICRTLLVEDDSNERELMSGFLRMSGFEVETAQDGLQAMIHLAKHERPDVVLMDMRMPRFDGRKAVAAIRGNPSYRDLKVFGVSGSDPGEFEMTVGPQGVNRWFAKPVDPQKIVEAIHEETAADCIPA